MRIAASRCCAGILVMLAALAAGSVATAQPAARPLNERGPADAPVTVVESCTYEPEACSRLDIILDAVLPEFGDRVRFVFHHVPADDTPAASLRYRAALAAGQQGQFWPMHELLMANRQHATAADLHLMARQLGLEPGRFRSDLDGAAAFAAAASDRDAARALNLAATPALLVNGRLGTAAFDATSLRAVIRAALPPGGGSPTAMAATARR
jgi:protein-disulfide isomerase